MRRFWRALPVFVLLVLCGLPLRAQQTGGGDVFSGADAPTYSDQFLTNCHQGRTRNIFAQLGMNPMACRGESAPTDSRGGCSLAGMTVLQKIGNTCYYCSPIVPPIKGILIPYDQVAHANAQGFNCGVDQLDPDCMAICSKISGDTRYVPPSSTGGGSQPPRTLSGGINGPCEDYSGLDMNTPEGRAAAYARCSDFLCQHNPYLERCKGGNQNQTPTTLSSGAEKTPCNIQQTDGVSPTLAALESFTAQVANAARDTLVHVTNQMAPPEYDLKRPGEGVRYMQGLLTGLGFRALGAAVPGVLRSLATGKPLQLPNPIYAWTPRMGTPGLPAAPANTPTALPPGVKLPSVLVNTPRPMQLQEQVASCGMACVKMVVGTVLGSAPPESYFAALAQAINSNFDPCTMGKGADLSLIQALLRGAGIQANLASNQTLQNLMAATQNGNPAIVHLGGMTRGHGVVVDGFVRGPGGNWFVLGRDPFNLNLVDPLTRSVMQNMGKRNYFVESITSFAQDFSGWVIYTSKPAPK